MASAQNILMDARLTHVRELKAEIGRLRAENARLRDSESALRAHFDMALLANEDLRTGPLEIWDGWNLILGAKKEARDRNELIAQAKETGLRIWIVLDGHDENVRQDGLVRISYTGGEGEQRADRLICDYVRAARYLGLADRITVRTNDKDLRRRVQIRP